MELDYTKELLLLLSRLDLLGTLVFAISGAMAAANKKLDLFGAAFIAFATALGGGTVRDILLGSTPVSWMQNINYILLIGFGVILAFLFFRHIQKLRKTLFLFDTIGIAVFTILGIEKALLVEVNVVIAALMGMVSAVVGGVIRDILINEIPLIFRKEVYATACLLGGVLFIVLQKLGIGFHISATATILLIIALRIIAIKYKIGLPNIDTFKDGFIKR